MFEELAANKKQIEELYSKYTADDGKLVKDAFKAFMAKYPDVLQIAWDQYAPYFNDGDACIFGVHEPTVVLASKLEGGAPEKLEHPQNRYDEEGYIDPFDAEATGDAALTADFEALWNAIPEDAFKDVFGEDAGVFVEKTQIVIEETRHD